MSAELLLEHLEYAAESPDAVPLVRRFILDMAVRGKLVSQNPKDEPATKLLERIAKEKKKLEKEGIIKQGKSLPPIDKKDIPFQIPNSWKWERLGNIFLYDASKKMTSNQLNPDKWLLELEDIEKNTSRLIQKIKTKERPAKSNKSNFIKGDVLYGKLRPYLNKVLVAEEDGYATTEIVSIRPYCDIFPRYVVICLKRSDFCEYVERLGQGTKMPRLRRGDAVRAFFPLPPLAEQKRIVSKVDKLMALCDELEKRQNEREESRRRLVASALHELKSPPESFAKSARFVMSHFADITTRPDSIKALRKMILDMAVRGKLVSQNPKDEPAIKLLERIVKEKRKLEKDGIIRQEKSLSPIDEKDIPFQIPNGWVWTQFVNIGLINPKNIGDDNMQVSFVPMRLIFSDYGKSHESEIRQWYKIKRGYTHFSEGDVGVAKINPCFENGKSTIFKNLCGRMGSGSTQIYVIRPIYASADYILAFVKSSLFIDRGIPTMTGTAGQKGLPRNYLISALFPLPPLAEQKRIVAKVDKLMALCDKLESSLTATQENRRRLLVSLLRADSLDRKNGANG